MSTPLKTISLLLTFLLPIESHATQGYLLSPMEVKAITNFIMLDIKDFMEGRNSVYQQLYGTEFIFSSEISSTYEENEVAADIKYKNKQLFVIGVVESINSGINDTPFLTLKGGSPFTETHVYFKNAKKDLELIAALKKGDKISLACIGGGERMGSPLLINCTTTVDFAFETQMHKKYAALFEAYYSGKELDKNFKLAKSTVENVLTTPLILANLPNALSICPAIRSDCGMDLINQLKGCTSQGDGDCDNKTKNDIKEAREKISPKLKQARGNL